MRGSHTTLASVVIPSGRPDIVSLTIEKLCTQTMSPALYEIILVTPAPQKISGLPLSSISIVKVSMLHPPGKMRNLGFRQAKGKFLLFIDDDCVPPKNWIEAMICPMHINSQIGAVGCRVRSHGIGFWERAADHALFSAYQYSKPTFRDLGSAAIAVRRKAFEDAGGFHETLLASEDWDFNLRLAKKGWKRAFLPIVSVTHNHRRGTLRAIIRQAFASGWHSGLTVQGMHSKTVSPIARLALRMKSPWIYPLLGLPYAMAITAFYATEMGRELPKRLCYVPIIFAARCAYQFGVWLRLAHHNGKSLPQP